MRANADAWRKRKRRGSAKMAYQTFRQEYLQVPPVTRAYTTACVLTTAAVVSAAAAFAGPPEGSARAWAAVGAGSAGRGGEEAARRAPGSGGEARWSRAGGVGRPRKGLPGHTPPRVLVSAPQGPLSGGDGLEAALAGPPLPASRESWRGQSTNL